MTFCTLELYNNIIKDLPPTPSKFHYIFNLRDLSRVFNGMVLTKPDRSGRAQLTMIEVEINQQTSGNLLFSWFLSIRFLTVAQFVRVWRNECLRIFHDRLIDETDKTLVMIPL